jgi:hypothetical protein
MENVCIEAWAYEGYLFKQWSDGVTGNTRCFTLTQDTSFTAEFMRGDGWCGDELYWIYEDSTISIHGIGDMWDYLSPWDQPWLDYGYSYFLTDVALPEGMTSIGSLAFMDCLYLDEVSIPSTVETINNRAFENCRLLSSVNFAEKSALTEIGNWAFYNCHLLKDLQIPEGVKTLGYGAFYGCTYLQELTLPSTLVSLDDVSFALCAKLQKMNVDAIVPPTVNARTFEDVNRSIPVYVPTESVPAYKAAPVWQEFNIQPKNGVTSSLSDIQSTTTDNRKVIRDGKLFIIRDGKTYNAQGAVIK